MTVQLIECASSDAATRYVFTDPDDKFGTYDFRDVPKRAGFRWDRLNSVWYTEDINRAARLLTYCKCDSLKKKLSGIFEEEQKMYTASQAATTDYEVPMPDGITLYPYQRAGIEYAVKAGSALIADEMGLGKTVQAIGYCNITKPSRVLLIVPASLRINWYREWLRFTTLDLTVGIVAGGKPENWVNTDVVIVNYDVIKKQRDQIDQTHWDVVICDEAHKLKNPTAGVTLATLGAVKNTKASSGGITAGNWVFLTGTPILNRPIELFPLINRIAPDVFNNYYQYGNRFCGAKRTSFGTDYSGASNLELLNTTLRSNGMVRRVKADVLTELPPKVKQVIPLAPNGATADIKREQEVFKRAQAQLDDALVNKELSKASEDPAVWQQSLANLNRAKGIMFSEISAARLEVAKHKIKPVVEHVLATSGKIAVMCYHRVVVDSVMAELKVKGIKAVKLTGGCSTEARQQAIDSFQNDPETKVFVGTIKTAVGYTITACSHVLFAELDYVPANIAQAEDRCHRIGQQSSVLVQALVFDGSLDGNMAKTLLDKANVIKSALDDDEADSIALIDEPITASVSRKKVISEAEKITDEQVTAIQQGLRMLVSSDGDRASVINGVGFNKFDGKIGHSLASFTTLTPRQAVLGKTLVIKYRKQLPEDLVETARGV